MRTVAWAALAVLVAGPALADQLHDIPWYQSHPAAREATNRLCKSDSRFRHDSDCINADYAANRNYADRRAAEFRRGFEETAHSPTYWANNRVARAAALAACRTPGAGYEPATCAAAAAGAAMAGDR